VVQKLAAWRETRARERDLPRNWILKDDVILDIARLAPQKPAVLADIRALPSKTAERYGRVLVEQVKLGAEQEPQPMPQRKRRVKPDAQEEALADVLQAQLRLLSDIHDINSAIIAGRKDLMALIRDEKTHLLSGWRREVAGDELLALRDGQRLVSIRNRQVSIEKAAE